MNLPESVFTIRCLVADTFRQSLAARTFWLVMAVSGLCILICCSVRIDGATATRASDEIELYGADRQPYTGLNQGEGHVSLAFGAIRVPLFRDAGAEVHFIEALLAKWVAGTLGTFLALVWTAGFLPEFLQQTNAVLFLAKPVPRWQLLVGKYLGVVLFVAFQAVVFIGGTWLALGTRTGCWLPGYLLAIPLVILNFAAIYSFGVLLAVFTRSTVICVLGTMLFWMACSAVNLSRHATVAAAASAAQAPLPPEGLRAALEVGYWALPKPTDLAMMLDSALDTEKHFLPPPELATVQKNGAFHPELSLATSFLAAVALLGVAARRFTTLEY
jgi:hypothetical protein